jgi:hypothetical protein
MYCTHESDVVINFSTFSENQPANCLILTDITSPNILCVTWFNNSCESYDEWPGLLMLECDAAFRSCLFRANAFDFLVATGVGSEARVIFEKCPFDFVDLPVTNAISLTTTKCAVAPTARFDTCPWPDPTQTPRPSRTPSPSRSTTPTETETPTLTRTPTESRSPRLSASVSQTPSQSQSPTATPAPTPISITVSGRHRDVCVLAAGGDLVIQVSLWPTFIVFPALGDVSGVAYDSSGEQTANLSTPTSAFAANLRPEQIGDASISSRDSLPSFGCNCQASGHIKPPEQLDRSGLN